jgi:homoserine/homoserine lactone efflux protein
VRVVRVVLLHGAPILYRARIDELVQMVLGATGTEPARPTLCGTACRGTVAVRRRCAAPIVHPEVFFQERTVMDLHTWLIYVAAVTGLSLSPGPNGLLALTHGAVYGWRKAAFTVAGGVCGFVVVIALSMFGIGALLQASLGWLTFMKWVGGAYLAWLGIQVWRSPPVSVELGATANERSRASLFGQGALSALTNPKVLLFFAAFLPHFIDATRSLLTQFIVMAGTFAVFEFATELVIVGMAQRINAWLARAGKRFNQVCGGLFVAIGAALPLRG